MFRLFSKAVTPSYKQWMKVPISPHPHQHLLSNFLIINTLVAMKCKWNDFHLHLLMVKNVEQLFSCVYCLFVYPIWRNIFEYFAHFYTGLLFYYWVICVFYIFWILDSHQRYRLQLLSSVLWVILSLSWLCRWKHKSFNFNEAQFVHV
jgi:hypothetical protein